MEDELGKLRVEKLYLDAELLTLKRELEVLEDKLNDTTRVLALSKEAESNAIRRYDRAMEYKREVEEKMIELRTGFDVERREMIRKLSQSKEELEDERAEFKERLIEKEDKLEGFRSRNNVLVSEIVKLEGIKEDLEFKLREKDGDFDHLMKKCVELNADIKEIKNVKVRNEGFAREMARLEAVVRNKDEQIAELNRRIEDLEAKKEEDWNENVNRIKVLHSDILEIVNKKDRKIEELEKEKVGLEKQNSEMLARYMVAEERLAKLEEDVVSHLCVEAKWDEKFGCSVIGKILSEIVNALDEEQGVTVQGKLKIGGTSEEDPAFVSCAKDTKCSLKSVINSEVVAETTMLPEDEHSEKNGSQKSQSPALIQISDSDDEEASCPANGRKRARASPVCFNQKYSDVSSSDDSLNPKRKIKKLEHVASETAKHGQPIAASDFKSDHKYSTPHNQTMPVIRRCKENLNRKVQTTGLEGYCKVSSRRNETDILKYMGKCQQIEENYIFERVTDMVVACKNDPVLCANAIRAMDRKGLLCSGQRGFKKCDIDRGTALAVYLVNCDPNSDKMSTDEVKQSDPEGLDICRRLICEYSHELFEMFKSNEDPLFFSLVYQ